MLIAALGVSWLKRCDRSSVPYKEGKYWHHPSKNCPASGIHAYIALADHLILRVITNNTIQCAQMYLEPLVCK